MKVITPSNALNAISIILTALSVYMLTSNFNRGLDFTDESYYLLSLTQASKIVGSTTFFSYILSLQSEVMGGSIFSLRLGGSFLLLLSSTYLSNAWVSFNTHHAVISANKNVYYLILPPAIAAHFFYYFLFLPTPSYNFYNLIGCSISFSSLLFISSFKEPIKNGGKKYIFFLAIGGVLAFLSKPTTGAIIGVSASIWIIAYFKKRALSIIALSILYVLILLILFYIYAFSSPHELYEFVRNGVDLMRTLGVSDGLNALLVKFNSELTNYLQFLSPLLIFSTLAGGVVFSFQALSKNNYIISKLLGWLHHMPALFFILLTLPLVKKLFLLDITPLVQLPSPTLPSTILLSIVLIFTSSLALPIIKTMQKNIQSKDFATLSLVFLSIVFCFAYYFGTSNHFLVQTSFSAIFISIAIMQISVRFKSTHGFSFATYTYSFLISALFLLTTINAMESPYRLDSEIKHQNNKINLLGIRGEIYVSEKTSKYINNLKSISESQGWEIGTPLFDTTGGSPGVHLVLGSTILGAPWLLGGYKGSDEFADKALSLVANKKCIVQRAWILSAPNGSISLTHKSEEIKNLSQKRYIRVGEFISPIRGEQQVLWKPAKPCLPKT